MNKDPYPYKEIGERLRVLRGTVSQGGFARMIGVQPQQYNRYEKGRSKPPRDVLEKIAAHTSASIDWILLGPKSQSAQRLEIERGAGADFWVKEPSGTYTWNVPPGFEDRIKASLADVNQAITSLKVQVDEQQRAALIDYVFRASPDLFGIYDLLRLLVSLGAIKRTP